MTDESVDFIPTPDPLLRNPRLEHATELPVLGMATRFESNSRHVIDTVEQAFGGWRSVASPNPAATEPLRVRIVVREGSEHSPRPVPVRHIAPDDTRVIVHTPGSIAISDPDRRESIAYVTTALAADRDHFRGAVLEATTLALLSHFDRHPLHAAAIARGGRAVLLAGESGSGKSTLAHLAHTAGMDVLSEDRVWVQLEPTRRVWGWPGHARLLTGKGMEKSVVSLARADHPACYVADSSVVCVLGRAATAALERIAAPTVVDALMGDVAPGFDRFPERHADVACTLAVGGGWRLTLSDDPRDALPLLEQMLSES
jgi:hypothetical protein